MKTETTYEKLEPPRRGRKPFDYTIFCTTMKVRVEGEDIGKVRERVGNLVTGAKRRGFDVKSHVIRKGAKFTGYVFSKEAL